jgi:addiction module RelB/DinJ family antitoxin
MKTAIINIKTKPIVKTQAQQIAEEMGFGLSTLINGFLNQLIKTRRVEFSTYPKEEPSEFMIKALKEAEEDVKEGRVSPRFDNTKEAIAWLRKESKKYAN